MINESSGVDLERDLSRLDLGRDADPLPLPTMPREGRREPCLAPSGLDDMFSTTEERPHSNLVSTKRMPTREPASPVGTSRFKRDVATGPSSELLRSIFNGITEQTGGGRTYAQLVMDDSGRWRVARTADADEILSDNER